MLNLITGLTKTKRFVGSIVEFSLAKGFVYGLCTHDLESEGHVIKLYKDQYDSPLANPEKTLVTSGFRTWIKFPLKHVLKEPEIRIVGSKKLDKTEKKLPIFRSLGLFAPHESPKGWWIIDGSKEVWVNALTPEMIQYPDDGIYSLGAIQDLYDRDIYPHSASQLELGPLTFPLSQLQ